MDADPNREVKATPGSGSKVANAPGSRQAPAGDSPSVDEGQAFAEAVARRRGPSPPPGASSGSTPPREAEGDPCSRGSLDSYRVTDRNGGNGEKTASHVSSQTGDDCPYPIEVGVDEWDRETGELEDSGIVLLPCGRKGCPVCGPRLRDRYTAHFARTFAELGESRPIWFLTLTVDPKVLPDDADELDARKYLTHCWEKYRKRLRRRAEDLKYAGAYEVHRDGDRWHLHMVVAADFPERDTEGEIREMLRVQWFESGGGAVAKVKRVREGRREPSTDGTPDGIAGAAGYVVKYAFKDAAHAHSAVESRRSVLASEGIGYYSEDARDERRAFREDQATGGESAVEREYRPLVTGGMEAVGEDDRGRADTLTKDDRERFEGWDKSGRTMEYKERVEDSEEWDGRTVWILWAFAPDAGRLHRTVWDTFPERTDAQKLADSWPSTAYDGGDT